MTDRASIVSIIRRRNGDLRTDQDLVAVEAPVTIELRQPGRSGPTRSLGVLMRTPGDDDELALGLLHGEGVIRRRDDIIAIRHTKRGGPSSEEMSDVIEVDVVDEVDLAGVAERAVASTSACGLCGRLEVQALARLSVQSPTFPAAVIGRLPNALRSQQAVFAETGGLHAAGLFDAAGACLAIREDVGRHNAVDKVIGWALAGGRLPANESILAVSGRVAFEIVQKAVLAGVPVLVAVGAPSSLAVEAARAARLTLVGFVRDGGYNVYTVPERLA